MSSRGFRFDAMGRILYAPGGRGDACFAPRSEVVFAQTNFSFPCHTSHLYILYQTSSTVTKIPITAQYRILIFYPALHIKHKALLPLNCISSPVPVDLACLVPLYLHPCENATKQRDQTAPLHCCTYSLKRGRIFSPPLPSYSPSRALVLPFEIP